MTTEEPIAPAAAAATAPSQGAKGKDAPASQKDAQQQHEQASNAAADAAHQNGTGDKAEEEEEDDPDLPKRIYAGNLSFSTGEEELKAAFVKFGAIKEVSIVRYNSRHMGFGFVTYEQEADAAKAIAEMNKTTLQEREISVQSARSKAESRKRRALRKARTQQRRKKNQKAKEGAENKENESPENAESSGKDQKEDEEGEKKAKKGKNRTRKVRTNNADRPKPVRGPPSTTTVFVGNLAFALTDEDLKKSFVDEGLNVTSAYVVRGHGRMAHRSKGFGFVELSDETQQKRAVEVMHNKKLQERTMSVRVALEKVANGEAAEGTEGTDAKQANGDVEVKTEPTA